MPDTRRYAKRTSIYYHNLERRIILLFDLVDGLDISLYRRLAKRLEKNNILRIEGDRAYLTITGIFDQTYLRNYLIKHKFKKNKNHPLYKIIVYKYLTMLVREKFVWQLRFQGTVLKTFESLAHAFVFCATYKIQTRIYIPETKLMGKTFSDVMDLREIKELNLVKNVTKYR